MQLSAYLHWADVNHVSVSYTYKLENDHVKQFFKKKKDGEESTYLGTRSWPDALDSVVGHDDVRPTIEGLCPLSDKIKTTTKKLNCVRGLNGTHVTLLFGSPVRAALRLKWPSIPPTARV